MWIYNKIQGLFYKILETYLKTLKLKSEISTFDLLLFYKTLKNDDSFPFSLLHHNNNF